MIFNLVFKKAKGAQPYIHGIKKLMRNVSAGCYPRTRRYKGEFGRYAL